MSRNMKDSGVEWIGEIPEDWELVKYKYFAESGMGSTILREQLDEEFDDGAIPVYSATQEDTVFGYLKSPTLILRKNDFVIPARGNSIGWITVIKVEKATCTQTTIYSRIRNINVHYLFHCGIGLRDKWFEFDNTAIPQLTVNQVQNNYVPVPLKEEQQKIATFLDQKVAEIDHIISKTQASIEEYKRYKQSIITEAVTKGLDPNVPMKGSGIEWIGEIPEKWCVVRLKYTSLLKGRIGWQGLRSNEYVDQGPYLITGTDFNKGVIKWDTCAHILQERYWEAPDIHIRENDLLITKDGTIGKVAIAKNCPREVSLNSGVMLIRNTKEIKYHSKFLYYVLLSDEFWQWYRSNITGNSTILHLYQEQFYNFSYALPSHKKQDEIVQFLDEKVERLDQVIGEKELLINNLESYKKSLIYEVVTGKKEVM